MIPFACAYCGRELDVPDDRAGQNDSCPHCGALISVPVPAASAIPPLPVEVTTLHLPQPRTPDALPTAVYMPSSEAATLAPAGTSPNIPVTSAVEIPGYEILGELGRGGMGVIYKARQLRPRRLVALKMILAGGYAGPDDLARFHSEAEAIAQLSHPNIVQIHQVGEHDGRPYLSLEFIEGGNLAQRLREQPYDFRAAAELVHALARAVQFAHQRGIIHRDLKPANILLTPDGTPKITDFGLAKQIEGSLAPAARTQSGAILGTPSYMAPEQAEGKRKNIGRPADIYALGAILYELLTGRPPFQAETMIDTLVKMATEEPVPPRQLRPKCPRDLQTVCLKCLRKQPDKRYASAGELADDLRRWLDGEGIQARPAGRIERLGLALRALRRRRGFLYLERGLFAALALVLIVLLSSKLFQSSGTESPAEVPPALPFLPEEAARRRSEAARLASSNNLRQLALAMRNFHAANKFLPPPAITDRKTGKPLLSWRVALLPFVEQLLLYKQFKLDEPWDGPNNSKLLPYMPNVFKISSMKQEQERSNCFFQVFVGPGTAFETQGKLHAEFGREGLHLPGDFPDGTANTLLIVEAAESVPWTNPVDLSYDPRQPLPKLGGTFEDIFLAVTVDGTVRFIKRTVSERTLRAFITRNDGEAPGKDG